MAPAAMSIADFALQEAPNAVNLIKSILGVNHPATPAAAVATVAAKAQTEGIANATSPDGLNTIFQAVQSAASAAAAPGPSVGTAPAASERTATVPENPGTPVNSVSIQITGVPAIAIAPQSSGSLTVNWETGQVTHIAIN